jgi:dolichol-phosphate mannosyltransferase
MKAFLVICVFNENVKLEMTAARVHEAIKKRTQPTTIDVIIVDDGSTEKGPGEIAKKYGFHFIRNPERKGVGYAIREAYNFGLSNHYDILLTMAGNNKDNPEELDRLMEPILSNRADFVQGSRYLPGGNFGNMPLYRQISTRVIHPLFFSLVSGQRITDSTNGFRAVSAKILRDARINLNQDWLDQYELEPFLFCKSIRLDYRVIEVPCTKIYPDKKLGYSKMKPITGWWSILRPLFYLLIGLKK